MFIYETHNQFVKVLFIMLHSSRIFLVNFLHYS